MIVLISFNEDVIKKSLSLYVFYCMLNLFLPNFSNQVTALPKKVKYSNYTFEYNFNWPTKNFSEHASYFEYTIQQNIIVLTMTPLASTIIEQNNFLNLQVVASNSRSSASTIVTLKIVKDDGVTPVFQRALYEGTYDPDSGLTLDQIVLVQGHDSTVQLKLIGGNYC